MPNSRKRFSISSIVCLFLVLAGAQLTPAQTPLKSVNSPEGGMILYGVVDGATSPAVAMGMVLRSVHNQCGERPQVGRPFLVQGTGSVAVFFTVVNHPQGNKQVAGMVIASGTGPNRVEAALVSHDAARFGSTVNPMLTELFRAWHPGGVSQPSGSLANENSVRPPVLHQVTAQDGTASVGIPDGWKFQGSGGTVLVIGPHYETVNLNLCRSAANPSRQNYGNAPGGYGKIIFPSNVDPVRTFPDLFQAFWHVNGKVADLRVTHIQQLPAPPGQRCVHASGRVLIGSRGGEDKDMPESEILLCTTAPNPSGGYLVSLSISQVVPEFAEKERATIGAIFASFQVNEQRVAVVAGQIAAPAIAAIHQIGADASARMNNAQQMHDIQNRSFEQHEDSISRNGQAFSNYLLDQTVIQDNNMYGNGTVGHGTAWNSTAEALVKADPDRFEIVQTPNFWKGIDY